MLADIYFLPPFFEGRHTQCNASISLCFRLRNWYLKLENYKGANMPGTSNSLHNFEFTRIIKA